MEDTKEKKAELPEILKNHSMAGKYEYETVCKVTGIFSPTSVGHFVVTRHHSTFRTPATLNHSVDPFPRLEEVTMEPGDALLVTPRKTGTHVLFEILTMLQRGTAEHIKECQRGKWIDVTPYDDIITNQSAPRVLTTHLPLIHLPSNFRRDDTKVVITIRNLKDTFVSFYHHVSYVSKVRLNDAEPKSWEEYFNYLLNSKSVGYGSYFDLYSDIWDHCRDDPNVLIVFFETLVRKKKETVESIAKHLEVKYTDQLLDGIATATEFKTMKEAKYDVEQKERERFGKDFSFYRKGEVGDWKNWFTVAQNDEFHRKFDEWNKERQIPMVFE